MTTRTPSSAGVHPQATAGEIDVREVVRLLLRQKWVVLGVLAAVMVTTVFVTMGLPKEYEASATLEYDPNPPRPLGNDVDDVANPAGSYLAGTEWYQTQNTIIGSRTIASKVVERLGLHRDAAFMGVRPDERAHWRGVDKDVAADKLIGSLFVKQQKETRVTKIDVRSDDPQRAAALANAIVDAYVDWVMEERLGSTVRAVEWLAGQLDDVSKRLDQSEHMVHDFRRQNNVLSMSLADQQNGVAQAFHGFGAALTEATTRRIKIEAKLRQLEEMVGANALDAHSAIVSESEVIIQLRAAYTEALAEHDKFATLYGRNHPEMRRVQVQVENLETALRKEVEGLVQSLRSELREAQDIERGLRQAKQETQNVGLDLNLREIEYNRLERERANNEKLHGLLLQRTTETNLSRLLRVSPVRPVDRARVPLSPVRPRPGLNLALGAVIGLVLGLAVAVLRMRLDRSIGSPEDVESQGATVLGLIPGIFTDSGVAYGKYGRKPRRARRQIDPLGTEAKDLIVHTHPRSSVAECCRTIRTNLSFMSTEKPLRTLLITSPGPTEGKSTVAISLAITLVHSGKRVLLLDTDMRRPRLHKALGVSSQLGVTSVLAGDCTFEQVVQSTRIEGLWLVACGPIPPNPSELLHTASFAKLLTRAQEEFDVVVLDSPPVGVVIDAAIIGPQVDGAIIIVKHGQTTRDAVGHALRQMRDVGTKILGAVLNDVDLSRESAYGGYYYYYRNGYYYNTDDQDGDNQKPKPPLSSAGASPPHVPAE